MTPARLYGCFPRRAGKSITQQRGAAIYSKEEPHLRLLFVVFWGDCDPSLWSRGARGSSLCFREELRLLFVVSGCPRLLLVLSGGIATPLCGLGVPAAPPCAFPGRTATAMARAQIVPVRGGASGSKSPCLVRCVSKGKSGCRGAAHGGQPRTKGPKRWAHLTKAVGAGLSCAAANVKALLAYRQRFNLSACDTPRTNRSAYNRVYRRGISDSRI